VAADSRQIVHDTFTRFMAGDTSMIQEIQLNAVSSTPVHQTYRQTLTQEPVVDSIGVKRQLDREEALFTIELHERYMTLQERSWALYEKRLTLQKRN
jgi:hypothetical protein